MNIFEASESGNLIRLQEILATNPDVNVRNECGETPAHHACAHGSVECLRALIERGADINAQCDVGVTLLMEASIYGNVKCVKELLQRGVDLSIRSNRGWTPLHCICYWSNDYNGEHLTCVEALLDAGIDPDAKDSQGRTALIIAHKEACTEIIDFINNYGPITKPALEYDSLISEVDP